MLPGFRFLFAAIVLSMSMLVFGLGAAALLRAAHEEVASNPSWRAAPETRFAQPGEATGPTLAVLRADPPGAEQKASNNVPPVAAPAEPAITVSAPTEPAASASTPAEPERMATLKTEDSPLQETAKPEIPVPENSAQGEAAPAPAEETKIAASEQVSSPAQILAAANEAVPAASEQASAPSSADADLASTKIATLGGPPVTIETPPAKAADAKPDERAIKKRLQARRAAQRRRIALRARVGQPAPAQPADPFAQPTITVRRR
jgi:hypothetical protein